MLSIDFSFDDDLLLDNQIHLVSTVEWQSFVEKRNWNLPLKMYSPRG